MNKRDPSLRIDVNDHTRGAANAKVTLVEFGDFECPACAQAHGALQVLESAFRSELRIVFRHAPQREVHPHAELAAEAAEAAGAQGKFWEMHDLLFAHQRHLDNAHLLEHARSLGLDIPRFENELRDHVYLQRVQEHLASAAALHVRATPTFYVNGTFIDVSFGLEKLSQAVEAQIRPVR